MDPVRVRAPRGGSRAGSSGAILTFDFWLRAQDRFRRRFHQHAFFLARAIGRRTDQPALHAQARAQCPRYRQLQQQQHRRVAPRALWSRPRRLGVRPRRRVGERRRTRVEERRDWRAGDVLGLRSRRRRLLRRVSLDGGRVFSPLPLLDSVDFRYINLWQLYFEVESGKGSRASRNIRYALHFGKSSSTLPFRRLSPRCIRA